MADLALACRELSVAYGPHTVFEGLSLDIAKGAWTAIVGPNGCGKSTLLRALGGLGSVRHGSVSLHGRPLNDWSRRERALRLGWLAQTAIPSDLTVADVVALGRFAHGGWLGQLGGEDEAAMTRAMQATGSLAWSRRRLSTLSGGERQRVHLARVLATEASVLLLDEPTTHLDPPHQEDIAQLLRQQAHSCGVCVISSIHDLSLALMADRLIVLGFGGLVGHGTVPEALAQDWLSRAFGKPLRIVQHEGLYLWQPAMSPLEQ
jgi:iron complex transport system ATP-binding protein